MEKEESHSISEYTRMEQIGMIIATINKVFNDNVELFDIFKDGKYLITSNRAGVSYITGVSDRSLSADQISRPYENYEFEYVGKCRKLYEMDGVVGTFEEHMERTGYARRTMTRKVRESIGVVGVRVNDVEYEMHDLDEVMYKPVAKVEKRKVTKAEVQKPKIFYKGENKEYVEYLFKSTFKGWRA